MAKSSGGPDLLSGKWWQDFVFQHFGVWGVVGFVLLCLLVAMYWNWETIRKRPGIPWLLDHLWPARLPRADSNRFSVLVAHLVHDTGSRMEDLIVEDLTECPGVQVLRLRKFIPFGSENPEAEETQGHELARSYLRKSGASVLIWGSVLSGTSQPVLKLYWTTTRVDQWKWSRYDAPRVEDQLRLPNAFWQDLLGILRVLVISSDLEFRAERGHYVADRLPAFIAHTQQLIDGIVNRSEWDAETRGTVRTTLADALHALGHQSGAAEPLQQAIALYRVALQDRAGERAQFE